MGADVMKSPRARAAVRLALDEDLASVERVRSAPWCDATSLALVDPKAVAEGEIYAKGRGCVVAGATVARAVLKAVDPKIAVKILKPDGTCVKPGEPILTFRGKARSILAAERTALNFMQRMCAPRRSRGSSSTRRSATALSFSTRARRRRGFAFSRSMLSFAVAGRITAWACTTAFS